MSTFGTPVQGAGTAVEDPNAVGVAVPSAEPQEIIDPNDPRLVSEPIEMNMEGDAYAAPAPPPDAKYHAKLKLAGPKNDKGEVVDYKVAMWGTPKQPIYVTGIEASIIDPNGKYDGIKVFDFNVATFVGRDGSSKVSTVLAQLRKPDASPWVVKGSRMNQKDWIDTLVRALAGEPEVNIETVWEWSCQGCGEEAKKKGEKYPKSVIGMQRFPLLTKDGRPNGHDPEMKCPVNVAHGYTRCRVNIARVLPLK